ncbi:DUF3717 domain-containing protein, partial [Klebsiella pneumoniae]|uniref:DUF3717 domain-containing protein n=1 Tax=Klebsiella pneumoniae TaxID=573 RepID=UPI003C6D98B0
MARARGCAGPAAGALDAGGRHRARPGRGPQDLARSAHGDGAGGLTRQQIHVTDLEAAINWWRERRPSPDNISAAP